MSSVSLLKTAEIASMSAVEFCHPLNPNSQIFMCALRQATALQRIGVTLATVPPGKESFIYHAHHNEEEWIYSFSGRGIAEIADQEYEIGSGDFMGFALPQPPHHLRNPFEVDLVYWMGGEQVKFDIDIFPRIHKRAIRDGNSAYIVDDSALNRID